MPLHGAGVARRIGHPRSPTLFSPEGVRGRSVIFHFFALACFRMVADDPRATATMIRDAPEPFLGDTAAMSSDNEEPGLWLWHGAEPSKSEEPAQGAAPAKREAPSEMTPGASPSRVERIADRLRSAMGRAGWIAPPGAMALLALAALAAAQLLPNGGPRSPNTATVQSQRPRSTSVGRRSTPMPPIAKLEQVAIPLPALPVLPAPHLEPVPLEPLSATQPAAGRAVHKTLERRVAHRSRRAARRVHASLAHRPKPMLWADCRYRCGWMEPMTWHGGGY